METFGRFADYIRRGEALTPVSRQDKRTQLICASLQPPLCLIDHDRDDDDKAFEFCS
jgi:hypothetical protein